MHPCAWNAVIQEWCKAGHNPRVSDSRKNVWVGKSLRQGENISGCLHNRTCKHNLYSAVVGASERNRLFCIIYRPYHEPTVLLKCVFCGRLYGSWKCRMWEIKNVRKILLENLWAGSVIWKTRLAMGMLGRFALCEIEMWAVLDRTEFGVDCEVIRLYCVTSEKWHNVKFHPRTGQEGPQRKKRFGS